MAAAQSAQVCQLSTTNSNSDEAGSEPQQLLDNTPSAVSAESCWLTSLQLMAVQPACLKAHPATPIAQQHLQQLQGVPGLEQQQHVHHDLLLHLEAVLTGQQHPQQPVPMQEYAATSPAIPLKLSDVELHVVLLSRQMQIIQQQQVSLLQLIRQQQGQHPSRQQPFVLLSAPTAGNISAATPCSSSSFSKQQSSQSSAGNVASACRSPASPASFTLSEVPGGCNSNHSSWSLALNLHVSMPCRPTGRLLDALHLVLTVSGTTAQYQEQGPSLSSISVDTSFPDDPGGAASSISIQEQHEYLQPAPALVAEVPLLVLPAVAQQEVQQLLLPAMRQEVQAEQQHQGVVDVASEDFATQVLQVEYAAWRHYSQLANDVFAVMELAVAVEAEAAAAAAAGAAAAPQMPSIAVLPAAAVPADAAQPPAASGSTTALGDIADALLFPLLLPFLAAHGLHGVLQLLVGCLPLHLQQQWQQQQLLRLQHLSAAAPPALQLPVMLEEEDQPADDLAAEAARQGSLSATGLEIPTSATALAPGSAFPDQQLLDEESGGLLTVTDASQAGTKAQQQEDKQSSSSSSSNGGWRDQPGSPVKPGKAVAASRSAAGGAGDVAAEGMHVTWLTPLIQFEGDIEQRYLAWKHHSLIHLDYLCVLFDIMYLAVLFKRMISEPTTLWYFLYICIKTLPHVPLVLGVRQPFLRYREMWLFLVAPACLLLTWTFTLFSHVQGQPTLLLPNRAYKAFIASRAELVTGFMRPFMQHMRLPQYIVYCVLDAAITSWVAGQVVDFWMVAKRWSVAAMMSIAICWVFDLVLRRRFVLREQQGRGVATSVASTASSSKKGDMLVHSTGQLGQEAAHNAAGTSSAAPSSKQKQL